MSVYRQIGMLSQVAAFRESVFNQSAPEDDFVLLYEDISLPDGDQAWVPVCLNGQRSAFRTEVSEHDEEFRYDVHPDGQMYGTLYHAVLGGLQEASTKKAGDTPAGLAYAVSFLLSAIRPLTYSAGQGAKSYQQSERDRLAEEKAQREAAEEAARVAAEAEAEAAAAAEAGGGEAAPTTAPSTPAV